MKEKVEGGKDNSRAEGARLYPFSLAGLFARSIFPLIRSASPLVTGSTSPSPKPRHSRSTGPRIAQCLAGQLAGRAEESQNDDIITTSLARQLRKGHMPPGCCWLPALAPRSLCCCCCCCHAFARPAATESPSLVRWRQQNSPKLLRNPPSFAHSLCWQQRSPTSCSCQTQQGRQNN